MSQAEDHLVNCPLDVVHRIRKSRMQTHLVRCLKNHNLASMSKVKCPFNPLHIVEAVEIRHHCQSCPDSENIVLDQFELDGDKCFSGIVPINEHQKLYDEMVQNNAWDQECISNKTAYDPTADIENKPVLRSLNCESKSKKREFRNQERIRFASMENNRIFDKRTPCGTSLKDSYNLLREPYSLPVTDEQSSVEIEKTFSELVIDNTEENQSHYRNNFTGIAEDAKRMFNLRVAASIESMNDDLRQLERLERMEADVKNEKRKLMNKISGAGGSSSSGLI